MSAYGTDHEATAHGMFDGWRDDAACYGRPALMDPPRALAADHEQAALQVCWGCPVRAPCLAWAMACHPDPGGVIGGLTELQRTGWRKSRARRARAAS